MSVQKNMATILKAEKITAKSHNFSRIWVKAPYGHATRDTPLINKFSGCTPSGLHKISWTHSPDITTKILLLQNK